MQSWLLHTVAAAVLLGAVDVAGPAAAQGAIGTGSGRTGASVALLAALIGVISGGRALARSAARSTPGRARDGAVVALVLGIVGMILAALHLATTTGAFYGAGNGRGGAVVASVLGLTGVLLGWRARERFDHAHGEAKRDA